MKHKLTVYELGKLLSEVCNSYKTSLLGKINLSGGWMTIQGGVEVESTPTNRVVLKGNNIISLKINGTGTEGISIKITGAKNGKFEVNIAPKKVIEIHTAGLGLQIQKEKTNQCTIKVDDSMIFTVNTSAGEVNELLCNTLMM